MKYKTLEFTLKAHVRGGSLRNDNGDCRTNNNLFNYPRDLDLDWFGSRLVINKNNDALHEI